MFGGGSQQLFCLNPTTVKVVLLLGLWLLLGFDKKLANDAVMKFQYLQVSISPFIKIPEFRSQKFRRSINNQVFSFLQFSYFEPRIFLKFYTKTLLGQ